MKQGIKGHFMLYKLKLNEPQTAHNELNKACIED